MKCMPAQVKDLVKLATLSWKITLLFLHRDHGIIAIVGPLTGFVMSSVPTSPGGELGRKIWDLSEILFRALDLSWVTSGSCFPLWAFLLLILYHDLSTEIVHPFLFSSWEMAIFWNGPATNMHVRQSSLILLF